MERNNSSNLLSRLRIDLLFVVACYVVLFLPVEVSILTSIYTVETPPAVRYNYRDFYFSQFQVPVIIWALLKYKWSSAVNFGKLMLVIAFKDIVYVGVGGLPSNIPFDFSLYLIMLTAWAMCVTIFAIPGDGLRNAEKFLDWYVFLAIASVFLRMALGMSTDGRYGAIGLSVGGTGFFMALYILFSLCVKRHIGILTFLAFISLILSGQRTNLFMCVSFCFIYMILSISSRQFKGASKTNVAILVSLGLLGVLGVIVYILGDGHTGLNYLDRIFDSLGMFGGGNLGKEDSVDGRSLSIVAALNVLSEHPLGISNVFYELQYYMSQEDYPTFPHSFLLANSLLWSVPVVLFCALWLVKLVRKMISKRQMLFMVPLYILLNSVIWGSPFNDYALLFIILFFLSYSKNVCTT